MRHIPFYANWFRFQLFWAASDGFHATLRQDPAWDDGGRSLNRANAELRAQLIAQITSELGARTDLLDKVIPEYPPFGKRMLRDNGWYKMLQRPNVELVTGTVDRIEPDAVIAHGHRYPADAIVLATGFQAARMLWPMEIRGRDGVSLRDLWGDDNPRAHLGLTVPGFPNFFMIYGPNTNLAHGGSAIFHSECQVRYIMLALREMIEQRADVVAVRQAPYEAYNARLDAALAQMSWAHSGVTNWYKNKRGRVVMNSPWRLVDYRNLTAAFDISEYEFGRIARRPAPATAEGRGRRTGSARATPTCPRRAAVRAPRGRAGAGEGGGKPGAITALWGVLPAVAGPGSAEAVKLGIEDFGGSVLGKPIELVSADHQGKPDVASTIVRRWFDQDGVDVTMDYVSSAGGIAVISVAQHKNKNSLITSA